MQWTIFKPLVFPKPNSTVIPDYRANKTQLGKTTRHGFSRMNVDSIEFNHACLDCVKHKFAELALLSVSLLNEERTTWLDTQGHYKNSLG